MRSPLPRPPPPLAPRPTRDRRARLVRDGRAVSGLGGVPGPGRVRALPGIPLRLPGAASVTSLERQIPHWVRHAVPGEVLDDSRERRCGNPKCGAVFMRRGQSDAYWAAKKFCCADCFSGVPPIPAAAPKSTPKPGRKSEERRQEPGQGHSR